MSEYTHVWFWRPQLKSGKNRKGMRCRVLVRGGRNSIMVELEDGERVITSRYAVRKLPLAPPALVVRGE